MKKSILFTIVLTIISFGVFSQNIGVGEPEPGSKLSVKGNFSVGETFSEVAAPENGVIIQGNVGIGVAEPSAKLDVEGDVLIRGSLNVGGYSFPNSDGTSGQVLTTNGSGTISWATISGGGGGLANGSAPGNTPYWNGSSWVVNSSNIYNNGGNVGIGTTNPQKAFEVNANQSGKGIVNIKNTSSSGYSSIDFFNHSGTQMANVGFANSGASAYSGLMYLATNTTVGMVFSTNNTERMRITENGKVGIGTSSPAYTLDITGNGRFTSNLTIGDYTLPATDGTTGQVLSTDGAGNVAWTTMASNSISDNTYYDVGSATVTISNSSWTNLSGLSRTFTLSSNAKVLINTTGGLQTTSSNSSGYSVVDVAIYVDGNQVSSTYGGGMQRAHAQNDSGYKSAIATWSTNCVLSLSSGSHTITVKAKLVSGSSAKVSGTNGDALQGNLITQIFY